MTSADNQGAAAATANAAGLNYRDAGVDIGAGDALVGMIKPLAKATHRPGVLGGLGGFAALFDLKAAGFADPVLVSTTDGVGTKLKVAIETGLHDTVGIDLVAMCVNDLVVHGAEPLFFLDYFATGRLSVLQAHAVIAGIASGCHEAGCALVGGETAEMPGMYADNDYDLAGFAVGAAERGAVLPKGVAVGDHVLGLASAGVHSNGFSLVRQIVKASGSGVVGPGAVLAEGDRRRDADDPDADLCAVGAGAAPGRTAEGGGTYHRRRPARKPAAGAAGRHGGGADMRNGRCRRCSTGWPGPAASRWRRCCGCSTAASAWRWWCPTRMRRSRCCRPRAKPSAASA